MQELTAEISFLAARIRIRCHFKLPDAIQIATAIHTGSSALITHNRDFHGVDEIKIIGIQFHSDPVYSAFILRNNLQLTG